MKIAIIDADLVGRKRHRFPNLVCMKLSGYYKEKGHKVELKLNYDDLEQYDKVFISKVFTDTPINEHVLELPNVEYGGTGFFLDKAPKLPCEIEHHMPDYHLYDEWVNKQIKSGRKRKEFEEYLDYSIGFTTRGCFRKCEFCVNKNYNKVEVHSNLSEFYDPTRKYICLLDDNILGYPKWKEIFEELISTGKPFKYKQGMDERILTEEKCEILSKCKYKGDMTFAFDDIKDRKIIEDKLKLLKKHIKRQCVFYVLCGFDRENKYDENFWIQDIINTFERIKILMSYGCLPYIMRFEKYKESPYKGMYIQLARWCNQPTFFKKKSFRDYANMPSNTDACLRYATEFENKHPDVAKEYYDIRFEDLNKNY